MCRRVGRVLAVDEEKVARDVGLAVMVNPTGEEMHVCGVIVL